MKAIAQLRGTPISRKRSSSQDGPAGADDLAENLTWADDQARRLLRDVDVVVERDEIDAPEEDWPADLRSHDARLETAPTTVDLREGFGTVIWATGYRPGFDWVRFPCTDDRGHPIQRRGVTEIPGLYVLGLDWLHTAKSGLFAGIDEDATYLAGVVASRQ